TKDTWSLVPSVSLPVDQRTSTQSLVVDLEERNVAGTQTALGAHFDLSPYAGTYGAFYSVPRLAGSFLTVRAVANVIQNRDSGRLEGSREGLQVLAPLRTNRSPWAAFGSVLWDSRHAR